MAVSNPLLLGVPSISRVPVWHHQQHRGMAGRKKRKLSAKEKHRRKMKDKQKLLAKAGASKAGALEQDNKDEDAVASHHRQWVDFQKSIMVDGFETGQMTEVVSGHTRNRHFRALRTVQRRIRARIQLRKERMGTTKTGDIPALEYSPEETERLLAEARSHFPVRTGTRGSRHRRRHLRRAWLTRKIKKKEKRWRIRAHFRRMRQRSERMANVMAIVREAPSKVRANKDYQLELFRRWRQNMGFDPKDGPPPPTTDGDGPLELEAGQRASQSQ